MSAYLRVMMVGLALCLLLGAMPQTGPCDARAEPLADTISLVADPSPGPAARYGLKKTKAALQANGVTMQEAATVEAAQGSVVIVAGLGKGSTPTASLLRSLFISPPEGAESLLIQHVRKDGKECLLVSGSDDRGLMYALLARIMHRASNGILFAL
jgi:hypothetical protein